MIMSFAVCWGAVSSPRHDDIAKVLSEREGDFEHRYSQIMEREGKLLKSHDLRERYEICYDIFNLSRSYKYDIAYKYSNEAYKLALEIGDDDLICQSLAAKLSTFTSGGLFTEAADIIAATDIRGVSDEIKREFFYNAVRYYSDQIDYATGSEYRDIYTEKLQGYADSIIMLSQSPDYYYTYATAYKESSQGESQNAIDALLSFYDNYGTAASEHHNSIITFLLALEYFKLGGEVQGYDYLSKSIHHDVKAAARENRSIKTMAQHLFDRGENKLSEKLINIAFEDAKFYNARHRNLEINTLLPIINEQRIATISRQRNTLYILLAIISMLGAFAVVAVIHARRAARILESSKQTIQRQLHALSIANNQLREANDIKEHYVIESLYKSNSSLKQVESLLKKIDMKVKNRLYGDLSTLYKEFNVKQERESFFSDFDRAFLRLFPNFIEEYNTLFAPENQIDVDETSTLPAEVRIFALMRLGITDNERISQFLDLSINTIYTYKTKVKSRSLIPKEEFEARVLSIKLSH